MQEHTLKTKEDFLGRPESLPRDNLPDYLRTMYDLKKVLKAMDEYAKQEAKEFAIWTEGNTIAYYEHSQKWEVKNHPQMTTEQLYQLFIDSKK